MDSDLPQKRAASFNLSRVVKHLPLVASVAGALWVCSWYLGELGSDAVWGRVASTRGLDFLTAPIWIVVAAAIGFVAGLVLSLALEERALSDDRGRQGRNVLAVVAVGALVTLTVPFIAGTEREFAAAPRVLLTTPPVERFPGPNEGAALGQHGIVVWPRDGVPEQFPSQVALPGGSLSLSFKRGGVVVVGSARSAPVNVAALDYVTRIDAIAGLGGGLDKWSAVAIAGRATGRRTLVLIVSEPDGNILHAELLERGGWRERSPLIESLDRAVALVCVGEGACIAYRVARGTFPLASFEIVDSFFVFPCAVLAALLGLCLCHVCAAVPSGCARVLSCGREPLRA